MENKTLGEKRVLQFNVYVGNLVQKDIEGHLEQFKSKNPLEGFDDVVCVYVPVRDELNHNQIIRIL